MSFSCSRSVVRFRAVCLAAAALVVFEAPALMAAITVPSGYSIRQVGDLPGSSNFYGGVDDASGNVYATGALSKGVFKIAGGGAVTTLVNPNAGFTLGIAAKDDLLAFGDDQGHLWTYNLSGPPVLRLLATMATAVNDIAFAPASFGLPGGSLVVGGLNRIDVVNLASGSKAQLASFYGSLTNTITLDFTPTGQLLAASRDEGRIYGVSATGVKTTFANVNPWPSGLAVHPGTGDVYVASEYSSILQKLGPTGSPTSTFAAGLPVETGWFPTALSFSVDGTSLFYADYPSRVMAIDGFASVMTAPAVPEPASLTVWALLLTFSGANWWRRRRAGA